MELTLAILIGFLADCLIGDPESWWHPVRGIGWLIERLEKGLRRVLPPTPLGELAAGGILAGIVVSVTAGAAGGMMTAARRIHPLLGIGAAAVMSWQVLAERSLKTESMKVYTALREKDVEKARRAVSRIVGRDTRPLSEEGIVRAAVETVAENTSDGVIAPLFYLLLFGPAGAMAYKAVNTMDSMVGYRNKRYLYFGRIPARLDDVANLIPARLTALFLIGAAWLLPGFDGKGAWKIWRRDRYCHKSPNSAQSEAACAGALGVSLAGPAWYFGELVEKPVIGEEKRKIEPEDIVRVNRLMEGSVWMALALGIMIRCRMG